MAPKKNSDPKALTAAQKRKIAADKKKKNKAGAGPGDPDGDDDPSSSEDWGPDGYDNDSRQDGEDNIGFADGIDAGLAGVDEAAEAGLADNVSDISLCNTLCHVYQLFRATSSLLMFPRGLWDVALNSSYVNMKFRTKCETSLLPYG